MPRAVLILEIRTLFTTLAEPERLILTDSYGVEPGITGFFISKCENNVDLF